ncbi:MAG TPA: enoyl-CoA hydratase-related protein [Candidatus Hydrogenedens sp.]|nr:enoyl-CoA hydratase-related protein [Candidatus Hydrogenedens sp.]HOL19265.1 enoyl-CoA hydratase-related protein [Candidatus Hydrogenedens sp.]HPP58908.1 enoyl-CoA hydratase-related protein [Candidatus Hydrogenedens sp.]
MSYQFLITEKVNSCFWITLNRPKVNALSRELLAEIYHAIEEAETSPDIKVVIITGGESKFFAAGADIPTIAQDLDDPMGEGKMLSQGIKTMNRIEACLKPVIAVVNGFALGGGCELALACHIRIASTNANFGQPEINLGIIPGWGGTFRLPRVIGEGRAMDLLLTGRSITADEALKYGLITKLVAPEELKKTALELADLLASKPPVCIRQLIKLQQKRIADPAHACELEKLAFERCAKTTDAREGIEAFLNKRQPQYKGR